MVIDGRKAAARILDSIVGSKTWEIEQIWIPLSQRTEAIRALQDSSMVYVRMKLNGQAAGGMAIITRVQGEIGGRWSVDVVAIGRAKVDAFIKKRRHLRSR